MPENKQWRIIMASMNEHHEPIQFDDYQYQATKTDKYPEKARLYCHALGLCSEAGEVADKIKKLYRDDVEPHVFREQLRKELGDVLWYVAMLAEDLMLTLSSIAESNLDKLSDRHRRNQIHGSGDDR
jgi:NTP pyrophosphatase (non-canonical NTP hydrolase)